MKILKKGLVYLLTIVMLLCLSSNVSYAAASTSFQSGSNTLEVGESTTISVGISSTESWNLAVTASGGNLSGSTSSTDAAGEEVSKNVISCQFSASTAGTYKIYLVGTIAGNDLQKQTVDKVISITVKEKEVTPPPSEEPETPTTPEQPSEPEQPTIPEEPEKPSEPETPPTEKPETPTTPEKPTEPEVKFTAVNETVYAEETVRVRKGPSTYDDVIGSLNEGESVTRIGIGSNGWSKVDYRGSTAYIKSSYLTTIKPEEEKSNNANLKSLTVEGQELLPEFSSDVTSYSMNVTTDVDKLEIKAEAEDEKATVDIKGNTELKDGDNTVTISVSAEDGTVKIYEIKVTRADEIPLGLKTLKIEGTDIHKTFKADVFEYEIEVEELEGLKIEAIANDEKASVEILESVEGDVNNITIIVKSEDGEETVTYQVTAKKVIVTTEEPAEESSDPQIFIYIGIIVVAGAALIGVLVYFIKNRNTQKIYYAHSDYEDEEDFEGFPEELPEKKMFEDEDNNLDPFRRRGKHF